MEYEIRQMLETDIPAVMKIENEIYATPWCEEMFRQEIVTGFAFVLIEKTQNMIAGYICGLLLVDEFNITNISVSKTFQKNGLGDFLLKFIVERLFSHHCYHFFLEVRESNLPAQKLYARNGFKVVGKRKKYYNLPSEDALIMQLDFKNSEEDEDYEGEYE